MERPPQQASDDDALSMPLRAFIAGHPAFFLLLDASGVILCASAGAHAVLGAGSPMEGRSASSVHYIFQRMARQGVFESAIRTGTATELRDMKIAVTNPLRTLHFDFRVWPLRGNGGICGIAIAGSDVTDMARVREQLTRQNDDLLALHEVSKVLRTTMDVNKSLFIICSALTSMGAHAYDMAAIFLTDARQQIAQGYMAVAQHDSGPVRDIWHMLSDQRRSLDGVVQDIAPDLHAGMTALCDAARRLRYSLADTHNLFCAVASSRRVAASSDPGIATSALVPEDLRTLCELRCFAVAPLMVHGELTGMLLVDASKNQRVFSEHGLKMLDMFADQAALALYNGMLHRKVAERALRDSLTGLYNHGYFESRLDDEIQRAKRYGEALSLLMFDIDHFKKFNDNHGHQTGDAVLVALSRLVRETVRATDVAFRYGGEEFTVLLPRTTVQDAAILAERLRSAIGQATLVNDKDGNRLPVTISMGIAGYPMHGDTGGTLVGAADAALYRSKAGGRNRVTSA